VSRRRARLLSSLASPPELVIGRPPRPASRLPLPASGARRPSPPGSLAAPPRLASGPLRPPKRLQAGRRVGQNEKEFGVRRSGRHRQMALSLSGFDMSPIPLALP
jgi:hypothetical protein